MSAIFTNIYALAAVVIFFGFSVFVHEFGHFLAARLCGLVVDVFSIGFGPALWKRQIGNLTLKIGAIPFGGYVALPQLDPSGMDSVQGEGEDAKPRHLPRVAVWKKIVVSIAGAAGNLVFAFVLAWIIYLGGKPSMPGLEGAVVGLVETNTVAYAGGLRAGDTVLAVNGHDVKTWNDFVQICSLDEKVDLRVRHADGVEGAMTLVTSTNANAFQIRMLDGVEQGSVCRVGMVESGSMAEKAGIKPGDIIKSFNGQVVAGRGHLTMMVQDRDGLPTPLTVERNGKLLDLTVTPVKDLEHKMIRMGIQFGSAITTPLEQIRQDATSVLRILKALITPKQAGNAARSIGGPVLIFTSLWFYAKAGFLLMLLEFVRLINVNLAILNLLPIPVLDGGHVVFALWEGITRRPPGEKVVRVLINFFAVLLIGLIVLISFRDLKVVRLLARLMHADKTPAAAPAAPGAEASRTGDKP